MDRQSGRQGVQAGNGVASPRVAGPLAPLPQKQQAARGPGTPWLAKLGSLDLLVKPTLWTRLCITWGAHGASLWIPVHVGVNCPGKIGREGR